MNGAKLSLFSPLQGRIHSTNQVAIPSIIPDIATMWVAANSYWPNKFGPTNMGSRQHLLAE